jgi:hypothetical protein
MSATLVHFCNDMGAPISSYLPHYDAYYPHGGLYPRICVFLSRKSTALAVVQCNSQEIRVPIHDENAYTRRGSASDALELILGYASAYELCAGIRVI